MIQHESCLQVWSQSSCLSIVFLPHLPFCHFTFIVNVSQFCHRTVNEEEEIAHKMLGGQFYEQLEILRKLMSDALYTPDVHQVR